MKLNNLIGIILIISLGPGLNYFNYYFPESQFNQSEVSIFQYSVSDSIRVMLLDYPIKKTGRKCVFTQPPNEKGFTLFGSDELHQDGYIVGFDVFENHTRLLFSDNPNIEIENWVAYYHNCRKVKISDWRATVITRKIIEHPNTEIFLIADVAKN